MPWLLLSIAASLAATGAWLAYLEQSWLLSWQLAKILSTPLEVGLLFDLFRCLFMARVLLIAGRVLLFSSSYMGAEPYFARFHLLVLRFVLSMMLLILRPNLIRVLLG